MFVFKKYVDVSGVLGLPWIEPQTVDVNCARHIAAGRGFWISV